MNLSEFLRQFRDATKLSGRKLAEEMAVDKFRLQKWEEGKAMPKLEDSEKIKKYFRLRSLEDISEEFLKEVIKQYNYGVAGLPDTEVKDHEQEYNSQKIFISHSSDMKDEIISLQKQIIALLGDKKEKPGEPGVEISNTTLYKEIQEIKGYLKELISKQVSALEAEKTQDLPVEEATLGRIKQVHVHKVNKKDSA